MKVRNGFVTNSSSSSYIIGKKDDTLTIEDVYQIVRKAYIRYYEMGQELKEFMEKYVGPFELCDEPHGIEVKYKKSGKVVWEQRKADEEKFKEVLPSALVPYIYDYFPAELYKWVTECPTYEDYKNRDIGQLFTILDYTQPAECDWVYTDVSGMSEDEYYEFRQNTLKEFYFYERVSNVESEVLAWYYPAVLEAFKRAKPEKYKGINEEDILSFELSDCSYLSEAERIQEKKEFDTLVERIAKEDIPIENACLYLLGKYCIYSEECFIPYVVSKLLEEQALFSCSHMG